MIEATPLGVTRPLVPVIGGERQGQRRSRRGAALHWRRLLRAGPAIEQRWTTISPVWNVALNLGFVSLHERSHRTTVLAAAPASRAPGIARAGSSRKGPAVTVSGRRGAPRSVPTVWHHPESGAASAPPLTAALLPAPGVAPPRSSAIEQAFSPAFSSRRRLRIQAATAHGGLTRGSDRVAAAIGPARTRRGAPAHWSSPAGPMRSPPPNLEHSAPRSRASRGLAAIPEKSGATVSPDALARRSAQRRAGLDLMPAVASRSGNRGARRAGSVRRAPVEIRWPSQSSASRLRDPFAPPPDTGRLVDEVLHKLDRRLRDERRRRGL